MKRISKVIKVTASFAIIFTFVTIFTAMAMGGSRDNSNQIRCYDCHERTNYLIRTGQKEVPICPDCGEFGLCIPPSDEPRVVIYGYTVSELRPQMPIWMCDGCAYALAYTLAYAFQFPEEPSMWKEAWQLYQNPSLR
jgi:ribosomal protein L37AE/L43A